MFGIGFFEILIILVVAVIFLGPDKLPQAIVDFVKFFRALKKSINEAKDTLDKELEISKLASEVEGIKSQFETQVDSITKDIDLGNLQEIKEIKQEINGLGSTKEKFQDELGDLSKNVEASHSLFDEYSSLPSNTSAKKSQEKKQNTSKTKTTTKIPKSTSKTTTKTSVSQKDKSARNTKKPSTKSTKSKATVGAI